MRDQSRYLCSAALLAISAAPAHAQTATPAGAQSVIPAHAQTATLEQQKALIDRQAEMIQTQQQALDAISRRLAEVEDRLPQVAAAPKGPHFRRAEDAPDFTAYASTPATPPAAPPSKATAIDGTTVASGIDSSPPNRPADDGTRTLARAPQVANTVPKGFIGIPGTSAAFKFGGRIQMDAMFYAGAGSGESEDFLIPRLISTTGPRHDRTRLSARDSRLNFDFRLPTSFGQVRAFAELDFLNAVPANAQTQVNNFAVNLRHAWFEVGPGEGKWTFRAGQDWSAFVTLQSYNDIFSGFQHGLTFVRQPQLRFTKWLSPANSITVSVENPQGDVAGATGAGANEQFDGLPDLVFNARTKHDWGDIQAGLLLRQIEETSPSGKRSAWGVTLGGRLAVPGRGRDNLRFQGNYGNGIGRYIGELGVGFDGRQRKGEVFDLLNVFAGNVSYQHYWSDHWYSTLTLSQINVDNPDDAADALRRTRTISGNIVFVPITGLEFGLEENVGDKTNETGPTATRSVSRFTGKFVF